jgi:CubicO group peptidase (beta-lactamase class C family)
MRKILVNVVALAVCAASLSAQSWPSDSVINSLLQPRLVSRDGVGIVVGLVEKGKPAKVIARGSTGSSASLDGNTVFEIGSISKVFTTAILADMVRRGEVKLDDPISKYLPPTVKVPSRGGKQITLLDLATQSSGLPRLPTNLSPANLDNPYAEYTVQKLYDFLSGYELPRDIGAQFEYSNLGMGLLGHILSLKAGKSYEELLIERILTPLGMNDTRITLNESLRARLAIGHDAMGGAVKNWDLPALAGAGAIRSTVNDLAKFMAANFDSAGPVAIDLAAARAPLRPAGSDQMKIGLAWITLKRFDKPIVFHNGQTGGYHGMFAFDSARTRGVILLENQSTNVDDIALHLLDERFPINATVRKQHTEVAIDPALLGAYVGVYEMAPNFFLAITREGDSLFGQATGQGKVQLFPESDFQFFLKVVDAQLTFIPDANGRVTQVVLNQNGRSTTGQRVK